MVFLFQLVIIFFSSSSDDDPDKIVNFDVFSHGLTQLIIVTKLKGSLTLFDLISCEAVCELVLPESHTIYPSLTSSAKPATNQSQYLGVLAKGQSLIAYGTYYLCHRVSLIFVFINNDFLICLRKLKCHRAVNVIFFKPYLSTLFVSQMNRTTPSL